MRIASFKQDNQLDYVDD